MPDRRLRIAMLSAHSCPVGNIGARDTGGMSIYIRELARELKNLGHSVDVYTRVHDPRDPQFVSLGKTARLIHLKAGEEKAIPKLAVYSYLPEFICNLENFRKQNNLEYDIIFSHYWLSAWAGEYLQRWWNVPHVTIFHTLGEAKNAVGIGEAESELRLETEKQLARNCHLIIASTEKEKERLVSHYHASPERVSVIPCGVNLELFQPMDKTLAKQQLGFSDNKIILFVGRIEPLKGINQLLKAMPYLPDTHEARLVIIGGDEHSQHELDCLQKLSSELHIQDSVTFLGRMKQEQLPCFYSAADVCVIPSYYESFGLVALESLACGTPVVATDVGNFKNIIRQGKTGFIVADNAPPHLANKIALLLAKPNGDISFALSLRASVSKFSWVNVAKAINQEFQLVLANRLAAIA
jgi:D-inositol-3-phosphate glycosyltransferase